MDEKTQQWFEKTIARSKLAAEKIREKRGAQSSSAAGVVDMAEPREWEFKGVKLSLVAGLNVSCRVLGAALDPAERRHLIFGRMWLDALGPSGETLGTSSGQINSFVMQASIAINASQIWMEALKELEVKLSESRGFAAVEQAAALDQVADVPSAGGVVHGVRI